MRSPSAVDPVADQFAATALTLSNLRRKAILLMTSEQPLLRREALQLRRQARGTKLGRRLCRKAQLGRAGSF